MGGAAAAKRNRQPGTVHTHFLPALAFGFLALEPVRAIRFRPEACLLAAKPIDSATDGRACAAAAAAAEGVERDGGGVSAMRAREEA